jgi:archaellum component FlaC
MGLEWLIRFRWLTLYSFPSLQPTDLENVQQIAVHDKQHFHAELERFQQVHDGLIHQLQEAQEAHRTLEKTLAMLVMEKEAMAKENVELKGVCEETMALLETYEQQGAVVR